MYIQKMVGATMKYKKKKWWGYIHTNGTIQVKRYFEIRDLEEARESPFVTTVFWPFEAEDREDAIIKMRRRI